MPQVYISLGSNIAPRVSYLRKGIEGIRNGGVKIIAISSLYRTAPVGKKDQPHFLNAIVRGKTSLSPEKLLTALQQIEKSCGRVRNERWGPRTLDLDILLYGNARRHGARLILPHPRMTDRRFVLLPLLEISPRLRDPSGSPYRQFFSRLGEDQKVYIYRRHWVNC